MANQSIPSGTSVPIEVTPLLDKATLALKTGATVKMKARRKSDAFAFDWDDLTFKALGSVTTLLSPNFVEYSATDFPGEYSLVFDLAAYSGLNAQDVYECTVIESGGSTVSNLPQVGEVRTGDPSILTAAERTAIDATLTASHGPGSWAGSTPAVIAAAVRDIALVGMSGFTIGKTLEILLGFSGMGNVIWDNHDYDGTTGFLKSVRLRVFANLAAARAATPGFPDDADGEVHRLLMLGTAHGTFVLAPQLIRGELQL